MCIKQDAVGTKILKLQQGCYKNYTMASFQGDFLSYVSSSVYPVLDGIFSNLESTDAASALVALHAEDALNRSRYINPIVDIERRNQRLRALMGDSIGILLLGANVPEYMERMLHPVEYWQKHRKSKDPVPTVWLVVLIRQTLTWSNSILVRLVKTLPSGEITFTDMRRDELLNTSHVLYPRTDNSKLHEQVPYVDLVNDPLKVKYTVKECPAEYPVRNFDLMLIYDTWCTAYVRVPEKRSSA